MPNWCNNTMVITGDKSLRDLFVDKVKKINFDDEEEYQEYCILDNLLPTPEELNEVKITYHFNDIDKLKSKEVLEEELEKEKYLVKYGHSNWYSWNIQKWGTKWPDRNCCLDSHNQDETVFCFDTAWSPPIEGLCSISKMFPKLTFCMSYAEYGIGFYGVSLFTNGAVAGEPRDMESIESYPKIDFSNDEDCYEKLSEIVDIAIMNMIEEMI